MHKNITKLILKWNFKIPWYVLKIKSLKKNKVEGYKYFRKITKDMEKTLKLDVIVFGEENIEDYSNNFMIYANHRGLFDPLLIINYIDKPLSFVMKSELEKNFFIRDVGLINDSRYLDRDPKKDMKTIVELINLQKGENNYLIFPEGTRNDLDELTEFKAGSFKISSKAKADICPVVLCGTESVFDSKEPKTLKISFLKPIKYEDYKNMKTVEISDYVKDKIQEEYNRIKNL